VKNGRRALSREPSLFSELRLDKRFGRVPIFDMSFSRQLIRTVCACLLLQTGSAIGSTPAVSLIGGPNGTLTASNPLMIGWDFSVTRTISINSLGFYSDIHVFTQQGPTSGQVGLWDASSTLIASCAVVPGDPIVDGFTYHAVSPLTLNPGQLYTIGGMYLHSEAWAYDGHPAQFGPEINFVNRLYRDCYDGSLATLPYLIGQGGFGPSFTYAVVPEPCSMALMALFTFLVRWGVLTGKVRLLKLEIESEHRLRR
jgi:hypothetical protein